MRFSATLLRMVAGLTMVLGLSAAMADVHLGVSEIDTLTSGTKQGDTRVVNIWEPAYIGYYDVDFGTANLKYVSIFGNSGCRYQNNAHCVIALDTIDLENGTGNFDTVLVGNGPSRHQIYELDTTITGMHKLFISVGLDWDSVATDPSTQNSCLSFDSICFYEELPTALTLPACSTTEFQTYQTTNANSLQLVKGGFTHYLWQGIFVGWRLMDFGTDSLDAIVIRGTNKYQFEKPLWVLLDSPDTAVGTVIGKLNLAKNDTNAVDVFDLATPVADTHSVYFRSFIGGQAGHYLKWFYFGNRTDITSAESAPAQKIISAAHIELTCKPQGLTYRLPANDVRTVYLYGPDGALIQMIYGAQSTGMIPVSNLPSGRFILRAVGNKGTVSYPFSIIR